MRTLVLLFSSLWVTHPVGMGFDFNVNVPPPSILLQLLLCSWMWGIFYGGFQHPPVDGCSAATCDFVLEGEEKHISFYSTIWGFSKHWVGCVFPFLPCLSSICKASSDNHLALLHFFFFGLVLVSASCTVYIPPSIVLQSLSTRSNAINLFITSTEKS